MDGAVAVPPEGMEHTAPSDYSPDDRAARHVAPKIAEFQHASAAADEVVAAGPLYTEVFTIGAPSALQLVHDLRIASKWSAHVRAGKTWLGYARTQEHLAWKRVLPMIRVLRATALATTLENPVIAARFRALIALLMSSKDAAKKGVATRRAQLVGTDGLTRGERIKVERARKREAAIAAKAEKAKAQRLAVEAEARSHASAAGHGAPSSTPGAGAPAAGAPRG